MSKWLALIGATIGGAVGWWMGSPFGFLGSLIIGMLGTAAGTYFGRRIARDYLV
jgi:uncharacterized protein YcfJ